MPVKEPIEPPSTIGLERLNEPLRDRLDGLTPKTHAFAQGVNTGDALYRLAFFEHNWLCPDLTDQQNSRQEFLFVQVRQC